MQLTSQHLVAAGCQVIDLLLNRQILVELPYLVSSLSTEWARRGGGISEVIRIPCSRGLEDVHGFRHHISGILRLSSRGELTERLDVFDSFASEHCMMSPAEGCKNRTYGT